jgi:hypothetical protein
MRGGLFGSLPIPNGKLLVCCPAWAMKFSVAEATEVELLCTHFGRNAEGRFSLETSKITFRKRLVRGQSFSFMG